MNHDFFYAEVGRRILRLRNDRKLTQEELGKRVSLTRTSITNIERGRQRILLHTLGDLAYALGVQPSELLPKPDVSDAQRVEERLKFLPLKTKRIIAEMIEGSPNMKKGTSIGDSKKTDQKAG